MVAPRAFKGARVFNEIGGSSGRPQRQTFSDAIQTQYRYGLASTFYTYPELTPTSDSSVNFSAKDRAYPVRLDIDPHCKPLRSYSYR
jgi:hypothetical protein